ncbi:MAG TPA: hypothetical protein DCM02_09650 [Flavobacterium sp.]|nr:hypothetical protein [Flavobacterium sp.]
MNSQTTSNYITTNIQPHLQDKFWSSSANDSNKVVLHFTQNQIHLYSFGKKFASDQYYITNNSCEDNLHSFEIEKIGTSSTGNYIKNKLSCYEIEFYADLLKFRMKRTYENDTKWQTFYLLNNPFTNTLQSGAYTKNNCTTGGLGSTVTYTVVAGKYISTVSQADADAQAQAEIIANGQNYANANGTCP